MGPKSRLGNSCWNPQPALSVGEDLVFFHGPQYLVEKLPISSVLEEGGVIFPPVALRLSVAVELRLGQALLRLGP